MGKQPFISHVVNGYSRYDVPESKAFTCTPGILYPVRIDFINARDRVSIEQGVDVRSNPLAVPTFNPYTIRLHRFWVPLQLYHPELRTNISKFDMNSLSLNWINAVPGIPSSGATMYVGERQTEKVNTARTDTSEKLTPREVYAQNVNSTVGITTSITTNYWGYQTTSAASGSGFILTEDGYILTNYHVIENSSSVQVTTYDNTSYSASIVGYDESNDIAVLKIDATGLTPVVLGSSDDLYVGDEVMAIGNPLGELTFSLTVGYVSALDREVTLSSGTTMDLIQTDAAINSGNSGGALFNSYGEVVGITNAKYSSSSSSGSASIDNIGFAIPINHVKNIITSIIEKGYIVKPYIGVSVTTVSSEMVSYGLPQGAAVKAVSENSPAAECGLKINDIITAINGEEITTSSELVKIVSASQPGDKMTLTVYRQGESEQLTLTLTVGEQQKSALADPTSSSNQQQSSGSYGGFPFGFGYGYGG